MENTNRVNGVLEVANLLNTTSHRIINLYGPAWTGKTQSLDTLIDLVAPCAIYDGGHSMLPNQPVQSVLMTSPLILIDNIDGITITNGLDNLYGNFPNQFVKSFLSDDFKKLVIMSNVSHESLFSEAIGEHVGFYYYDTGIAPRDYYYKLLVLLNSVDEFGVHPDIVEYGFAKNLLSTMIEKNELKALDAARLMYVQYPSYTVSNSKVDSAFDSLRRYGLIEKGEKVDSSYRAVDIVRQALLWPKR